MGMRVIHGWLTIAELSGALSLATAQQPAMPKLRLVQEARIDGAAADISGTGATLITRDGGVIFVEPQDFRLRFYDASGKEIARFGRRGEGPGEFSMGNQRSPISAPVDLGRLGDTTWAFNARRFTLVSSDGKLIRTFAQPAVLPGGGGRGGDMPKGGGTREVLDFRPRALLAGGSMLGVTNWGRIEVVTVGGQERRMRRDSEYGYAVASPAGEITRVLAMIPSSEAWSVSVVREGRSWGASAPFAEQTYQSVAPDGSRIAIGTTTFASEQSGALHLLVVSTRGDTLLRKDFSFAPVPISKHAADSAVAQEMRYYRPSPDSKQPPSAPPDVVSEIESKMRAAIPKAASVYRGMFIGADNSIWLLGPRRADGGREYFIFDERGNPFGSVSVGKNVYLGSASTRTAVWAEESDQNDVDSLIRYRIVKG